ncbi:MAG: M20/M25/M40 family metallo-hydrolase [Pirellulaceae bacterium]|nr:M20/M25/M40 family metallo-hydrolase [Pirellulaceae bacterium]
MDPLTLAQQLINCDSDTACTNAQCASLIQRLLQQRGFEVHTLAYRDLHGCEKVNLSAVRAIGNSTVGGLAFFCHSDVVSSDGWRVAHGAGPNDAAVHDGRLWGRGACDMKGPIASALAAIDQLDAADQRAPIYFFVTGDEECGMLGAEHLVKRCPLYRRAVTSQSVGIVTEPTEMRVVNAHKGGCRFRVVAHGVAAHSSTSGGLNANWQLIRWLGQLQTLAQDIEKNPSLLNPTFDPPHLNLNIVIRNQPAEFNISVGQASCEVFLRTMPDTQWQRLVDQLTTAAREMRLEVTAISSLPPLSTPADRPFVIQSLETVKQQAPAAIGYATDACRFSDMQDLIVLGPGSVHQAHRCDEWIALDQLQLGAEIYSKLLRQFVAN